MMVSLLPYKEGITGGGRIDVQASLVPFINITFLGEPTAFVTAIQDKALLHSTSLTLGITTLASAVVLSFIG